MFKLSSHAGSRHLFIEILMIVIGINIALWFEGWFQQLQDAEIEARYLADLRDDLLVDIGKLESAIAAASAKLEGAGRITEHLPTMAELPPDELADAIFTPATYQFFEPSDFTYRSMQESGDFRLLRNADIKKGILKLDRHHKNIATLQLNHLQAVDDGYIPLVMTSFDIATMRVTDPKLFENQLFRNFFSYVQQDTYAMLELYKLVKSESELLVTQIDNQLELTGA